MTRLALLVPLVLSLALLSLAVPRLLASVLKAPSHRTVLVIESGETADPGALDRAATYAERATRWEKSAGLFGAAGFMRLQQVSTEGRGDPARAARINAASESLRQALQLSPARPQPWVRLAYARALEGADRDELVGLLSQSVRAGPYVAEISVARLDLLLRLWRYLTPELRGYAMKQVRYIWPHAGHGLLRLAGKTPRPDIIRLALRRDPLAVERVDAAIARRPD